MEKWGMIIPNKGMLFHRHTNRNLFSADLFQQFFFHPAEPFCF